MAARYNVLFLCNENTARSIFAEVLLNRKGWRHFKAFSAGTRPKGLIHPLTLKQLEMVHLPTLGLRSKSMADFAKSGVPSMNLVFAMCDKAAKEACPAWPGLAVTGDWNVPDPTAAKGTRQEIEKSFEDVFGILQRRSDLLLALLLQKLSDMAIHFRRHASAA